MTPYTTFLCSHSREKQIFTEVAPGHIQCTHYRCVTCGRIRPNQFFRRRKPYRVHPLIPLLLIGLTLIAIGYLWLSIAP